MATLSSVPQTVDLRAYAGDTYTIAVHVDPAVVAGRSFAAHIRRSENSPDIEAEFTITPGLAADEWLHSLTAEQTAALYNLTTGPFKGVWDTQLAPTLGGDPTVTLVQGAFTVEGDVTRVS
jgi:hypothetical protein